MAFRRGVVAVVGLAGVALVSAVLTFRTSSAQARTDIGGLGSCTTNSNGFCTVTHGLGSRPGEIQVTPRTPLTNNGATNFSQVQADSPTTTTFRVPAIAGNGNALGTAQVTFWWHVWAASSPTTTPPTTAPPTTTEVPTTTEAPTTLGAP